MRYYNSDEEARARRAEAASAPFSAETESGLISRLRRTARFWLLVAAPATLMGAALTAVGALLAWRQGIESIFWWFCVLGGLWLVMAVVTAMMLAEAVMGHHYDRKIRAVVVTMLTTVIVLTLAVVLGAMSWSIAFTTSLSLGAHMAMWGQLVPLLPVYRACFQFRVFEQALRRFDARNQPHELATPRRSSTAQGSTHLQSSRNSRRSGRQWLPLSWDRPSLHETDPAEAHGDNASHHSRRASLASNRFPRHHDTDSSADSTEDVFPYDNHPPHPRTSSTPSARQSDHLPLRRNPSNESLPNHDIFDLPRRSTASNIAHSQSIDPAAPHQTLHVARPSHSAPPSKSNELPSDWQHDESTPF